MDLGTLPALRPLHSLLEENDYNLHNGISVEIIINLKVHTSECMGTFLLHHFFIQN